MFSQEFSMINLSLEYNPYQKKIRAVDPKTHCQKGEKTQLGGYTLQTPALARPNHLLFKNPNQHAGFPSQSAPRNNCGFWKARKKTKTIGLGGKLAAPPCLKNQEGGNRPPRHLRWKTLKEKILNLKSKLPLLKKKKFFGGVFFRQKGKSYSFW